VSLWPAALVAGAAAAYYVFSRLVVRTLSFTPITRFGFPERFHFEAYARWDAAWYHLIATRGYFYDGPRTQSAVAFFPAYPTAMRGVGRLLGDTMVAGVLVTIVATGVAAVLLHRWATEHFDAGVAALLVVLLLCSPYAWFLLGVMYSDALFLVTAIAAFLLLERRHPWLSAAVAALATAERPVGLAVTAGLLLRSLELDGVLRTRWGSSTPGRRWIEVDRSRVRLSTLAPVASVAGLVTYCAYLWVRFDEPFAFVKTGDSVGWNRDFSLETMAKVEWFEIISSPRMGIQLLTTTVSALMTIAALALLPRVLRRLGPGYFAYAAVVVVLPALTAPEFIGMGRYLLVAFPVFAVAADLLRPRLWLAGAGVACSLGLFVYFASHFVRGHLLIA
jgi:hypothetical protein